MDSEPDMLSDSATDYNLPPKSDSVPNNQARLEALEKKAVHLRLILEKDFKAADMRWSLFVAAALSFRYDSCLRPFPPAFLKNCVKDMDELLGVIADVPALDLLLQKLENLENLSEISHILELLFYVLVRLKEPALKSLPPEAHDAVLLNVNSTLPAMKPQHIFQVVSSSKSTAETKWTELSNNSNIFYAFHGNKLENFYSILHFGLQLRLNKNTMVGKGVYLSPELSLTLPYSHCGFGWGASCLGGHLSCVALCEVIDAPGGINYQEPAMCEGDTEYQENKEVNNKKKSKQNPEAFYIVTNYDLIRVRYLLVYAKRSTSIRFSTINIDRHTNGIRQWLSRHKLFSILLGYGLMLATIGFANNQPMYHYFNTFMNKLDTVYGSVKV